MRIEQIFGTTNFHFVIVRGRDSRKQFFCFFVDSDSACWSKRRDSAATYSIKSVAEESLTMLKERAKSRRAAARPTEGETKS